MSSQLSPHLDRLPARKAYVRAWKLAHEMPEHANAKCLNWYPETKREILWGFSRALQKRINTRGGLVAPELDMTTPKRQNRLHLRHMEHIQRDGRECKWCGQPFTPKTVNDHCCSSSCERDYRS